MAKNKKLTFAQRAAQLEKKFPRASFDATEKRDFEAAMDSLMQEQEAVRASMGLTDEPQQQQQQFPEGGYMNSIVNSPFQTIIDSSQPLPDPSVLETDKLKAWGTGQQVKAAGMPGNKAPGMNSEMLPYAISGASNLIGNLLLNKSVKNRPIGNSFATPERINLEPQAEAMRKQATTSKNINTINSRVGGLNSMQAMAGMGAGNAAVDRQLGDNLTGLYMQQEGANIGAANQMNSYNAMNSTRTNMANAQMQMQTDAMKRGYLEDAIGTIPGVMKDIRMDKADTETKNMMRAYYKSLGKNYATVGDIFSGEDGFDYVVRSVDKNGKITKRERV